MSGLWEVSASLFLAFYMHSTKRETKDLYRLQQIFRLCSLCFEHPIKSPSVNGSCLSTVR